MKKIWVKVASYRGTWEEDGKVYRFPSPFQVEESDRVRAGLKCNVLQKVSEDEIPKDQEISSDEHEDDHQ